MSDARPPGYEAPMRCWDVPLAGGVVDEEGNEGGQANLALRSKVRQFPIGSGVCEKRG